MSADGLCQLTAWQPRGDDCEDVPEDQGIQFCWSADGKGGLFEYNTGLDMVLNDGVHGRFQQPILHQKLHSVP